MVQCRKRPPFRSYAKLVVICLRLCKNSLNNLSREWEENELVLHEYDQIVSWRGLMFKTQDFIAKKTHCFKMAARHLLEHEPECRSEDDISVLLVALRQITAFAEYPRKMQRLLCQVGRYECYQSRRVILRESDPPRAFYFILSGTVLVTAREKVTGSRGTVTTLTKGMLFGELAVISKTIHQETVYSKTEVELLSISGFEFENISMTGDQHKLCNERQTQFMRNVSFLHHWPIERLRGNCQTCTVYNFHRNQVLVRDSNNSDWIYIVLKGSLSVMKKFKRVKPTTSRTKQIVSLGDIVHTTRREYFDAWYRKPCIEENSSKFSNQKAQSHSHEFWKTGQETFKSTHELEMRLEQSLPGYRNHAERFGSLNYNKIIDNFYSRLVNTDHEVCPYVEIEIGDKENINSDTDVASYPGTARNNSVHNSERDFHSTSVSPPSGQSFFFPDISHNNKNIQSNHNKNYFLVTNKHSVNKNKERQQNEDPPSTKEKKELNYPLNTRRRINKTSKGAYLAPSTSSSETYDEEAQSPTAGTKNIQYVREDTGCGKEETPINKQSQYRRRQLELKTDVEKREHKAEGNSQADLDSIIVQLQVLERGQYFGVSSLLFPDQPSLSVVSNGAECLVLSKKFFIQWASEKCLRHLRQTEHPYPSDFELYLKLQEVVNWNSIRSALYHELSEQICKKKESRKQFVSAYQGQYCFRTGPV